eukprot:1177400-Prorocentrum_minimum.AAC.2
MAVINPPSCCKDPACDSLQLSSLVSSLVCSAPSKRSGASGPSASGSRWASHSSRCALKRVMLGGGGAEGSAPIPPMTHSRNVSTSARTASSVSFSAHTQSDVRGAVSGGAPAQSDVRGAVSGGAHTK